jgi:hypothetical protein
VAFRLGAGSDDGHVVVQRIGEADTRSLAIKGLRSGAEGTTIALNPRTGELTYLTLADQRDIALLSLRQGR